MRPGQYVTVSDDSERDFLLQYLEENTNAYWEDGVKPTQYVPRTLEYPYIVSVRGSQLFSVQSLSEIYLKRSKFSGINTVRALEEIEKLN